jgi:hypothetical protein
MISPGKCKTGGLRHSYEFETVRQRPKPKSRIDWRTYSSVFGTFGSCDDAKTAGAIGQNYVIGHSYFSFDKSAVNLFRQDAVGSSRTYTLIFRCVAMRAKDR